MAIIPGLLKSAVAAGEELGIELPEDEEAKRRRLYAEMKAAKAAAEKARDARIRAEIEQKEAERRAIEATKFAAILALGIPDFAEAEDLLPYVQRVEERFANLGPIGATAHTEARYWGWTKPSTPASPPAPLSSSSNNTPSTAGHSGVPSEEP